MAIRKHYKKKTADEYARIGRKEGYIVTVKKTGKTYTTYTYRK